MPTFLGNTCYNALNELEFGVNFIMKSKWILIGAIVQLVIGLLAIASFVVLSIGGENMTKWIITLFLAFALVVIGVIGIMNYKRR